MKLVCQQCGYENETERIYCHNCGTKLDRSQLPAEDTKKKKKKRIGPPPSVIFLDQVFNLIKTVVLAALVAAIYSIFKPVAEVPELTEDQRYNAPFFQTDLEAIAASQGAASRQYEQWQVNAYVMDKAKPKKNDAGYVKVTNAFVELLPGQARVFSQLSVVGAPVWVIETFEVNGDAFPVAAKPVSLKLGGLTIPSFLVEPAGVCMQPFAKRVENDLKALKQVGVRVEKEKVIVFSKPGGAPSSPALLPPGGP